MRITLLASLLLLVPSAAAPAAETPDPAKVLMIGCSFLYAYNIPIILDGLCEAGGKKARFTQHAGGDWTLVAHLTHKLGGATGPELIAKEHWDLIILVDGNFPMPNDPKLPGFVAGFKDAARQFRDLGAKTGTPVMLYSGFIWIKTDQDIKNRLKFNNEAADDLGLICAPTLQAVLNSKKAYPNLAVTDDQREGKYATHKYGLHQSPYCAYLGACTIYAAIYNQSPVGLKFHKSGSGKDEMVIDDADALAAQQVAWDTWKTYRDEHKAAKKTVAPARPVSSAPATPASSSAAPSPPKPNNPASSASTATIPIPPPTSSRAAN